MLAAVALLCLPGPPPVLAAPAFVVSVCLADVEYSIACRERSSLEAARRLEQIFIDDYKTGQTTGSLQVWFPIAAPQSEQLRFLREVEDRAIEAAARKIEAAVENPDTPTTALYPAPPQAGDQGADDQPRLAAQLLQQRRDDIRNWRQDAAVEARKGANWSHDWATRTHLFKPGPALRQLIGSASRERVGN